MKKLIAGFFALAFLTAAIFAQTAKSKISPRTNTTTNTRINEMIIATIIEAQENVYDYDGDGQINCLDYSCVFKLTWDKNFPREKYRCSLVRNYQPDVMNHLFAQVQDENFRNIEIETWTDNPYHYLLTEIWPSDRYNPAFNRYDETERWLSEENRSLKPKKAKARIAKSYSSGSSGSYFHDYSSFSASDTGYFSVGYMGSIFSPNSGKSGKSSFINSQKFGIEVSTETAFRYGERFAVLVFDYLLDHTEEKSADSWLLGFDWGYCLIPFFQPYFGLSAGMKWQGSFSWENLGFAWKVSNGFRCSFSSISLRAEVSYSTILGIAGTVAAGFSL